MLCCAVPPEGMRTQKPISHCIECQDVSGLPMHCCSCTSSIHWPIPREGGMPRSCTSHQGLRALLLQQHMHDSFSSITVNRANRYPCHCPSQCEMRRSSKPTPASHGCSSCCDMQQAGQPTKAALVGTVCAFVSDRGKLSGDCVMCTSTWLCSWRLSGAACVQQQQRHQGCLMHFKGSAA